jgi:phospholipid/cholesterol/gamma-HCH transport system substrate-binding protein
MRRIILVAITVFGVAVVFLTFAKYSGHRLQVKAFFLDAHGVRAGAPVRVAGVDVGRVTEVHVRTELKERPAEVTMLLQTPHELKIPTDSIVLLGTTGVLGETYPVGEIRYASGPPVENGEVLETQEKLTPHKIDHGR